MLVLVVRIVLLLLVANKFFPYSQSVNSLSWPAQLVAALIDRSGQLLCLIAVTVVFQFNALNYSRNHIETH